MVQTRRATVVQKEPIAKLARAQRTLNARVALMAANNTRKIVKEAVAARAKDAKKIRLLKRADEKRLEAESRAELSARRQNAETQLEDEAKAILSAKRRQAVSVRWNKSVTNQNRRMAAVDKTRKTPPLRKSISVQVDCTSEIINQLSQEKEALLCRLIEPKKRETKVRKPLHALHRSASISRVQQIIKETASNYQPLKSLNAVPERSAIN